MPGICGIVGFKAKPTFLRGAFADPHAVLEGPLFSNQDRSICLALDGDVCSVNSPAEIVQAYEKSRREFTKDLRGAFALALWDGHRRRLLLARDRAGIRPLYYAHSGEAFVFGSQISDVLRFPGVGRALDPVALDRFLTYEFIPGPATIFKAVRKLLPAHVLVFDSGKIEVERYWKIPLCESSDEKEERCAERLLSVLRNAIHILSRDMQPPLVLLSGGIDSSAVVALLSRLRRRVRTVSVGFADRSYDERAWARSVARAFGTDHHERIVRPDVARLAGDLIGMLDQPFADSSVFPTFLAYESAREFGDTVLTGDGGDELFGGYDTLAAQHADTFYRILPAAVRRDFIPRIAAALPAASRKRGPANTLKRFVEGAGLDPLLGHIRWRTVLSPERKKLLYSEKFQALLAADRGDFRFAQGSPSVNEQLLADFETYLPDYTLTKIERIAAAHSLRIRMPFLDPDVIETAAGIPIRLKLSGFRRKIILKKAMAGRLPARILTRGKEGFSAPIKHWLRRELKPMLLDTLSFERIMAQGLFSYPYVKRMVDEHLAGRQDHSHRLWSLIVFRLWHERNAQ